MSFDEFVIMCDISNIKAFTIDAIEDNDAGINMSEYMEKLFSIITLENLKKYLHDIKMVRFQIDKLNEHIMYYKFMCTDEIQLHHVSFRLCDLNYSIEHMMWKVNYMKKFV